MTEPAAPSIDADKALTIAAGVFVAVCLVVWVATQLATWYSTGDWHDTPLIEAPRLAFHLALHPDQPTPDTTIEPPWV